MIRPFLTSLLFVFLSISTSLADCTLVSGYSNRYRFSALDVTVEGNDLWVATSYGITLYDRTSSPPRPVTSLALPGTTSRIRAIGSRAYVASGAEIIVVSKGQTLRRVGSLDLAARINDLFHLPPYLYAATSNGVIQIDLLSPENPVVANRLTTTSGDAFSLARIGTTLYAADGDRSVEVYSLTLPSFPQKLGTFDSLPRVTSVRSSGARLFASDGQQTEIFIGNGAQMVRAVRIPTMGSTSLFPLTNDVTFIAGSDRTLRAVDFTQLERPVVLFEFSLSSSGGTINRIEALTGADGFLYAAAGDHGLMTLDTSRFRVPFPLRSHSFEPMTSVFSTGAIVYASAESQGLFRFAQDPAGALVQQIEWDNQRKSIIHDGNGGRLLTSSGNALTLWDISLSIPAVAGSAMMRSVVSSAVLQGTTAFVVLADRSLWRVDLTGANASPVQILSVSKPAFIAGRGSALVVSEFTEQGTTLIHYFATGDFSATPVTASIEGVATNGVAAGDGGVVLASTFRGLTFIDFAAGGAVRVVAGTNNVIARDLASSGTEFYILTATGLEIWSASGQIPSHRFALPSSGAAVAVSGADSGRIVSVATLDGITSILPATSSALPVVISSAPSNRYYRKILTDDAAATLRHLYLFDGKVIDVFRLSSEGIPNFVYRIAPSGGAVDIAVIGRTLFTFSSTGKILAYRGGEVVSETQLSQGNDLTPLRLHAYAGALYVAFSKGCLSGNCEKKTLVFDVRSGIVETSSLMGALLDISGGVAIFELPDEIRVLSVADPYRPAILRSRGVEGDAVSVEVLGSTVYTLGEKLYVYSLDSLSKLGELLEPFVSDPSGRVAFVDQRVRIFPREGGGSCAVISGRGFGPRIFDVESPLSWKPVAVPAVPAAVRGAVFIESLGRLYLLSDYSLEIWRRPVLPNSERVRAARP